MNKFILASFVAVLSVSSFAADATGKYSGKIMMDLSGVKAMLKQQAAKLSADKKKGLDGQIAAIDANEKAFAKAVIKMEMKKDHSLTISQSMSGKSETDSGKWSQTGNKVKLYGFSGKNGGPKEMNGVLNASGKVLTVDLSNEMKQQAIKNGAPASFSGKMVITFTKG